MGGIGATAEGLFLPASSWAIAGKGADRAEIAAKRKRRIRQLRGFAKHKNSAYLEKRIRNPKHPLFLGHAPRSSGRGVLTERVFRKFVAGIKQRGLS
jgi:hypothetical protein